MTVMDDDVAKTWADARNKIDRLRDGALVKIEALGKSDDLEKTRIEFLGKKSYIMGLIKLLGRLSAEERPEAGAKLNAIRTEIEVAIETKKKWLQHVEQDQILQNENFDISLPSRLLGKGHFHPVAEVMDDLIEIFVELGFMVEEGPEVETDEFNFKMLNFPDDHPARDMQDTFYIGNGTRLMRTHTSPVQIHAMKKYQPPMSVIAPGRVYRCDSDVTHSPVFHQLEGFYIDKNVNFGHLKGTLELFVRHLYGDGVEVRFRPSFFPFTEPSAEIDISCVLCHGGGCRVCKETGWLEILGAGMIDPNVLSVMDINPEKWTGFAFGLGIERIAMLKYGIDDIRLLYENNIGFLQQF